MDTISRFSSRDMMVNARGEIARDVDDEIGALIYSVIGNASAESQLRHHLSLSQNSVRVLYTLLKELQLKHRELESRYDAAKIEASMSATALRQKIGEFDTLKMAYDQLLKECELFRNDREIFAEAAEDAEERRAEADRRAVEAEQRALEAEQRENAVLCLIEDVLKASSGDKLQTFSSPELKERLAAISGTEHSDARLSSRKAPSGRALPAPAELDSLSRSASKKNDSREEEHIHDSRWRGKSVTPKKAYNAEGPAKSPLNLQFKDARGTKRVLFDASKAREEIKSVVRRKVSKNVLMDRTRFSGSLNKVGRIPVRNLEEKENFKDFDAEVMAKIEEAAVSDNETARYLAELLIILKRNLVKAEAEGDLLYAKYCEIHKLLMDTLETFGIFPDICEGRSRSDGS